MKQKFANALSLALIVAMLFTSAALADTISGDVIGGGSVVSLGTVSPGGSASDNASASLTVTCNGNKHATVGNMSFSVLITSNVGSAGDANEVSVSPTLSVPAGWPADSSGCPDLSPAPGNQVPTQIGTLAIVANVPVGASSGTRSINIKVSSNDADVSGNANFTVTYTVSAPPPPLNTAPSISVTGVSDGASYNKGSVPAATCSVVDTEDGNSTFAATLSAITGSYASDGIGSQTASCSYTDAGGLNATASATYSIVDPSVPSIGYTLSPASPDGSNGWYKSNVSLTWNVSEPESPSSLVKTGCVDQNIMVDQAEASYSCSATSAGGSAGPVTVSIKRDGTAPSITVSRAPDANVHGWNNSSVTASYEASDGLSGLVSDDSGSHLFDQEGAGQSYIFTVSDFAGNSASATVENVNIDLTGPTLSLAFTPDSPDGNNGWWKTAGGVPFVWTCSDGLSGIDSAFGSGCPSPLSDTIAAQGTTNFSDQVQDLAGNLSVAVNRDLKLDNVAPVVAVTGVAHGATYILGSVPAAGCTTSDATSGVATNASFSSSGGPVGSVTASCNGALDNAGNSGSASVTYSVIYNWSGFFQPVDNLPALNRAKAGSAIPVKFSLGGNQGLNIFMAGYPSSVVTACGSTASADDIETTMTAGGSSLAYDAVANQYIYVWKTDKSWAGTCRTLTVKLNDGTIHQANFTFIR